MFKFLKLIFIIFMIFTNAIAGEDGELNLSKQSKPVKDCFEPLNRATFSLNQGLDKAIFEPLAKGYRTADLMSSETDKQVSCSKIGELLAEKLK